MDAMALVRKYGKPDIFLTMTCNPIWDEIKNELCLGQEAQDRQDLMARVFRANLEKLRRQLLHNDKVHAYVHVVEFQKRGLPHAHWLLIMQSTRSHALSSMTCLCLRICQTKSSLSSIGW
jgi:hypothetical protein